jgi:hypothetical protein
MKMKKDESCNKYSRDSLVKPEEGGKFPGIKIGCFYKEGHFVSFKVRVWILGYTVTVQRFKVQGSGFRVIKSIISTNGKVLFMEYQKFPLQFYAIVSEQMSQSVLL